MFIICTGQLVSCNGVISLQAFDLVLKGTQDPSLYRDHTVMRHQTAGAQIQQGELLAPGHAGITLLAPAPQHVSGDVANAMHQHFAVLADVDPYFAWP